MSTPGSPVCAPDWLALREPADAAARSVELVEILGERLRRDRLPGTPLVVRDLGCGSGSMGRWLAPRLPGPQTWVLHDRDADLLALAAHDLPATALDGAPVTARTEPGDLADLRAADLAGTSLVTASALLDLLTVDELDALAGACVDAGCPALLTLSVTGRVQLSPAQPRDAEFAAAFDAHQRRTVGDSLAPGGGHRRLLGPDAGAVAVAAFDRRGATVLTRSSPWLLDCDRSGHDAPDCDRSGHDASTPHSVRGSRPAPDQGAHAALTEEWLRGWIAAACVQRPELQEHAPAYLRDRLDACAAGRLRVTVGHLDVLALPAAARPGTAGALPAAATSLPATATSQSGEMR